MKKQTQKGPRGCPGRVGQLVSVEGNTKTQQMKQKSSRFHPWSGTLCGKVKWALVELCNSSIFVKLDVHFSIDILKGSFYLFNVLIELERFHSLSLQHGESGQPLKCWGAGWELSRWGLPPMAAWQVLMLGRQMLAGASLSLSHPSFPRLEQMSLFSASVRFSWEKEFSDGS